MKYVLILFLVMIFIFSKCHGNELQNPEKSSKIYQFKINDINEKPFNFDQLKNKVVLIVNVASKCGFTNQYHGLENLYKKFKDKGFVVIGVPSNDFGGQEPGTAKDIETLCRTTYNVTFPILQKSIIKGKNIISLYDFLTNKKIHPKTGGKITWNFNKFLIDREGHVRFRYSSFTKPNSKKIEKDLISLLSSKGDKNEKN